MTICEQEIFGPVMSIVKYSNFDDAIARANKSEYGLAAGIITKDIARAFYYANNIDSGIVWLNTYVS